MTKVDNYKVRIKFEHGNAMSLDLKGCGSIYIEPHKDYFFENAPMQFINYLAQLRRLGVTYRLTDDKKGCYMTIDLSGYQTNEPKTVLGKLRSNLVQSDTQIVRYNTVKDSDVDESTVEDLIPAGTFKNETEEITLKGIDMLSETTPEEITEVEEVTEENNEPEEAEPKIEILSNSKLEELNKTKLIDYAHSLGLEEVSDLMTKKEIREAIKSKIEELQA